MKPDGNAPVCAVDAAVHNASCADCTVCPLDALDRGRCGRVVSLGGAPPIVRRLLALGVRPSTECRVLGRAPNGGPLHLRAGSVHLMVRAEEAAEVLVRTEVEQEAGDVVQTL